MQFRLAVLEDGGDVVNSVMRLRHRNDDQQKMTNEHQICMFAESSSEHQQMPYRPTGRLMEALRRLDRLKLP